MLVDYKLEMLFVSDSCLVCVSLVDLSILLCVSVQVETDCFASSGMSSMLNT